MSIQFIKCGKEDVPQIFEIIRACSKWLSDKGMEHWNQYYTEDIITKKIEETDIYGVAGDGVLQGVVSISPNPPSYYDKIDIDHFQEPESGARYMSMLATNPEIQKSGLATRLMAYAENEVRNQGIKFMRLDVIREYEELNGFYQKREYQYTHWSFDGDDNSNFYEKEL
jgi:ribosomal protein S18 acetylase RimI-like enzyme